MPSLMIAIGKKGPPPPPGSKKAGPPPPPRAATDPAEPDADDQAGSKGLSPEEVSYSANNLCSACVSMQGDSCAKYGFPVEESGHCEAGFEPKGGDQQGDDYDDAPMGAA